MSVIGKREVLPKVKTAWRSRYVWGLANVHRPS